MRLRIYSPTGQASEIVVTASQARLGRERGCEVFFDPNEYPMVSGEHASIQRSGDVLLLTPVSKTNKTLLNDQPIEKVATIKEGDRIRLGYTGPYLEVLSVNLPPESVGSDGDTSQLDARPIEYVKDISDLMATPPSVRAQGAGAGAPKSGRAAKSAIKNTARDLATPARRASEGSLAPEGSLASASGWCADTGSDRRSRLALDISRYPKGVLWGGAGVIVVAVIAFLLIRGRTTEPASGQGASGNEKDATRAANSHPAGQTDQLVSVDALALVLKDGPASERTRALTALGRLGPTARPALAAVLGVLSDKRTDAQSRKLAQDVLGGLGKANEEDLAIYGSALRDASEELRVYGAGQLGGLGRRAKRELVFLRVLSLDDNERVKDAAWKAVASIEEDLLAGLVKDLQDKSAITRGQAARDLADMGPGAKVALPALVEALADPNAAVRRAVVETFVAIGPDAVMALGEAVRDKNPEVRVNAIHAVGRMGADARFVLPELIAVLFDPDPKVKDETFAALARIGAYAIDDLVFALEREKNPDRQQPLIEALEKTGKDAGPILKKALERAKPEAAKAAAQVLDKIAAPDALEPRREHTGDLGLLQAELRSWFNATDTNKDDMLDKEELARAIRGRSAKPYDFTPDDKPPRKFGPSDFRKYPDYALLCRLDRDNDGKISRDEFDRWAYDYATVMKKDLDDRDRIQKAYERLQERGLTEAMRVQREAALAQLWANYNSVRRSQDFLFEAAVAQLWNNYYNLRFAQMAALQQQRQVQWLQRWALSRQPRPIIVPPPPPPRKK